MRNLYYIAIEGPIGVGKTSLAELLSKELGARLVLEDFEDNPFLPDFYNDPERFGFQTIIFLITEISSTARFEASGYVSKIIDN